MQIIIGSLFGQKEKNICFTSDELGTMVFPLQENKEVPSYYMIGNKQNLASIKDYIERALYVLESKMKD